MVGAVLVLKVHRSSPIIREVFIVDQHSLADEVSPFMGLPSVYAHVVHVPCSPISPVIVALNALPPVRVL